MALCFIISKKSKLVKPEEPKVFVRINLSQSVVGCVDFIPGLQRIGTSGNLASDLMKSIEFNNFRTLVEAANIWLSSNLEWEVITCETVPFLTKNKIENFDLRNDDTCFYDFAIQNKYVVKGLRIWIQRRTNECTPETCQNLNYVDLIPEKGNSDSNEKPSFEKKDSLLRKLNAKIENNEIKGRIVSINTAEYAADSNWNINTDVTLYQFSPKCIYIFRVFFDTNSKSDGEIDIEDFVPKNISKGGLFSKQKFESMNEVTKRIESWVRNRSSGRIINIKTVQMVLSSKGTTDTTSMAFEYQKEKENIILVYRVFYEKKRNEEEVVHRNITYSQFVPKENKETINHYMKRINDSYGSIKSYIHGLLSAESIVFYSRHCTVEDLQKQSTKSVFKVNPELSSGYIYFATRIFFDFENES